VSLRIGAVVLLAVTLSSSPPSATGEEAESKALAAIEGRVTDASGKPVLGAHVDFGRSGAFDPFGPDQVSGPVKTAADGSFRITPRASSMSREYTLLRVRAEGYIAQLTRVRVDHRGLWWRRIPGPGGPEPDPETEYTDGPIAIELRAMKALFAGRVLDAETRAPVAGVRCVVSNDEAVTDGEGHFQIPLAAGGFRVWLSTGSYSKSTWVNTADGNVERALLLHRGRRTLKVRVVDSEGRPVDSPELAVAAEEDGNIEARRTGNAEGLVELSGLSAGPFAFVAHSLSHGFGVRRGVTPGVEPTTITLVPGVPLRLRVTDENGLPLVRRRLKCSLVRIGDCVVDPQWPVAAGGATYLNDTYTDKNGNADLVVPSDRFALDILSDRLESGRLAHDASKDGSETAVALGW